MRKRKYYKTDRRGPIICMLITAFIFMLSVGYAALNEDLTISGEAHFRVEADIRITDVSLYTTTYSALEDYNPSFGKDSMKVGVTLPSKTSTVTYKVTVTNYGNVAMQLKSITKEIENNNYTITFNKTLPLTIGKTSSEEIEITFSNNTNESQTINANLLFTFAKLESMMAEGNKNAATSTFYNGTLTKDSIESITFMSTKEIPEEAIGYWDCSYNAGSNEVMAYYFNSETEGMYDLYIAADGEVYAPVSASSLFHNFNKLVSINFNNSFNTEKATTTSSMFYWDSSLTQLDVSSFDTSNAENMSYMFYGCSSITGIIFGNNYNTEKVTSMHYMFDGCSKLLSLDLSRFNTLNVTDMGGMFYNCKVLNSLDISSFRTPKLTSVGSNLNFNHPMFGLCSKLKSLDLSKWDTSKITSMYALFIGCTSLSTLNITGWSTESVTSMYRMFDGCSSLTSINLENFDTKKVTSMGMMFRDCQKITSLDLSKFTTEKLTDMWQMFCRCIRLNQLDIRNMNFEGKTINTSDSFYGVPSGINIYVLNEYNQTFIQGLKSNANVIIYVPPEEEEVEEG